MRNLRLNADMRTILIFVAGIIRHRNTANSSATQDQFETVLAPGTFTEWPKEVILVDGNQLFTG